jgi:hypothetical protein
VRGHEGTVREVIVPAANVPDVGVFESSEPEIIDPDAAAPEATIPEATIAEASPPAEQHVFINGTLVSIPKLEIDDLQSQASSGPFANRPLMFWILVVAVVLSAALWLYLITR